MATTLDLLKWGLDASAMFRAIGLCPDPWQVEFLQSAAPRVLMLAHRQAGKSTVVAVKALHKALFRPGSLVLIASPTQTQSNELFRKIGEVYDALGRPLPAVQENAVTLGLSNGSRVVSCPGSPRSVRGYSAPAMIIVDEAAQADDDLFVALSPMMATVPDSPMVWVSTPWGQRGEFFRAWEDTGGDWARFRVTADRNPRISRAFLEAEKRRLGQRWFNQEFLCDFVAATGQVFDPESIAALMDTDEQPLFALGG
jgi:hypothetical protein